MEGLSFSEIVMHKLGKIEQGIEEISRKLEESHKSIDNRLKPIEVTHKRVGWLVGAAAGFGATIVFILEKIGSKWLSLL